MSDIRSLCVCIYIFRYVRSQRQNIWQRLMLHACMLLTGFAYYESLLAIGPSADTTDLSTVPETLWIMYFTHFQIYTVHWRYNCLLSNFPTFSLTYYINLIQVIQTKLWSCIWENCQQWTPSIGSFCWRYSLVHWCIGALCYLPELSSLFHVFIHVLYCS